MCVLTTTLCLTSDHGLRRIVRRTLQTVCEGLVFVESPLELMDHKEAHPALILVDRRSFDPADLEEVLPQIDWETKILVVGDWASEGALLELLRNAHCDNLLGLNDDMDEDELVVTSIKILKRDIFGLEKYVTWGTPVRELEIATYDEKRVALAEVADFARSVGCRRQMINRIEIVSDELLMNALYDAPATHYGKKRAELVARATPGGGPVTDKAVNLRFACDGKHLVVSVLDRFGELKKDKILEHLQRASREGGTPLKSPDSGAGLGLYFIINSVSRFIANIKPGCASEVICMFDLRTRARDAPAQARSLNIFFAQAVAAAA